MLKINCIRSGCHKGTRRIIGKRIKLGLCMGLDHGMHLFARPFFTLTSSSVSRSNLRGITDCSIRCNNGMNLSIGFSERGRCCKGRIICAGNFFCRITRKVAFFGDQSLKLLGAVNAKCHITIKQ